MVSIRKQWGQLPWAMATGIMIAFSAGCHLLEEEKAPEPPPPDLTLLNKNHAWVGFPQPCATPDAALILVEKTVPKRIHPKEKFEVEIKITNRSSFKVNNITLTEDPPEGFAVIAATPKPQAMEPMMRWDLGVLAANTSRTIKITGQPKRSGTIRFSGEPRLSFELESGQGSGLVKVISPDLDLAVEAPGSVIVSEPIKAQLRFTNKGMADVRNARLVHTLPKGLVTFEGLSRLELNAGHLNPGQDKTIAIDFRSDVVGVYETKFTAVADDGITATATMKVAVTKPVLRISGSAPKNRFVGNVTPYDIVIENVGDAIARDMVVNLALPENTALRSVTENGEHVGNQVIWRIPALNPGEKKSVSAQVIVKQIMVARAVASAVAKAADQVETAMVTDVAGIEALACELTDTNDPVPLGEEEIYHVLVTNQGSLNATRILVKCTLDDAMGYIKSSGATKGSLDGNVLTFELLPSLEPQASARWQVVVKAKAEKDARMKVTVESDQLTRPVTRNEATHFYK